MKKTYSLCVIIVVITNIFIFAGCSKNDDIYNISSEIISDSEFYYGKVIKLTDFPEDKLLTAEYMDKVNLTINPSDIGGSPQNALVALVFDKNLVLYTAKRYNNDLDKNQLSEVTEYLTDIQTFYEITGLEEATEEYAQFMNNTKGEKIWVFDAYVKFFEKRR